MKGFLKRVYTEEELRYCQSQKSFYECLSARWACKEAVLKAFYHAYGVVLKFSEIEVLGDRGKPARVRILRKGFERSQRYAQAHLILDASLKPEEIVEEILKVCKKKITCLIIAFKKEDVMLKKASLISVLFL